QRGPIAVVTTSSSSKAKESLCVQLVDVANAVAIPLEPLTELGNRAKVLVTRTSTVSTFPQPRSESVHLPGERPAAKLPAGPRSCREIRDHARPTADASHASHGNDPCRIMPSSRRALPARADGHGDLRRAPQDNRGLGIMTAIPSSE